MLKVESNQATLAEGCLCVSLLARRADWMKDFSPFHHLPPTADKQSRNCNCRYDPKTDTWTTVASLSVARDAVGVCLLGDRLYAVGGYDGQSYLSTVESYDAQNNEWTEVRRRAFHVSLVRTTAGLFLARLLREVFWLLLLNQLLWCHKGWGCFVFVTFQAICFQQF